MKSKGILIGMWLGSLLCVQSACHEEELDRLSERLDQIENQEPEIENQEPEVTVVRPAGIVLRENRPICLEHGGSGSIEFRVNPSDVLLSFEDSTN